MNLTLQIPDDLAERMGASGDLSRRALESFARVRIGLVDHDSVFYLSAFDDD